ncbi:TPA: GpE family phage tail protein [Escherichia coli]|nr:GpE family phage tail protein [Escherichia coli]HAN4619775.1 GpE family phage tail protein [Escherichia coli]HAW2982059.1 GpE family phage tail protein [Escherichia coli]
MPITKAVVCSRISAARVTEVLEWRYKAIQRSGANDE